MDLVSEDETDEETHWQVELGAARGAVDGDGDERATGQERQEEEGRSEDSEDDDVVVLVSVGGTRS
jgi:hypothetical protein